MAVGAGAGAGPGGDFHSMTRSQQRGLMAQAGDILAAALPYTGGSRVDAVAQLQLAESIARRYGSSGLPSTRGGATPPRSV